MAAKVECFQSLSFEERMDVFVEMTDLIIAAFEPFDSGLERC